MRVVLAVHKIIRITYAEPSSQKKSKKYITKVLHKELK